MKIHVLGNPRVPTGLANRMDPFSVIVHKYIKHLSPRYEMVHYGLPGADVHCEHVDLPVEPNLNKDNHARVFNTQASLEIGKRKSKGDLIACFFGAENAGATIEHPELKVIEPSIGYRTSGVFAPYRVFASYAQMHMYYGERGMLMNPSWYDDVIPNPFTVSEFDYKHDKQDYFVYFGRVCEEKGVHLAIQATEKLGVPLVIAGPGDLASMGYSKIPDHVKCMGLLGPESRRELLANAKCLLGLTYYVEPFGNMVIEANLSGTPVITTDWGAFPETVINGETGFRIRNFNELLVAMQSIHYIDPYFCRLHGQKYSDENVHEMHDKYLQKVIKGNFYG